MKNYFVLSVIISTTVPVDLAYATETDITCSVYVNPALNKIISIQQKIHLASSPNHINQVFGEVLGMHATLSAKINVLQNMVEVERRSPSEHGAVEIKRLNADIVEISGVADRLVVLIAFLRNIQSTASETTFKADLLTATLKHVIPSLTPLSLRVLGGELAGRSISLEQAKLLGDAYVALTGFRWLPDDAKAIIALRAWQKKTSAQDIFQSLKYLSTSTYVSSSKNEIFEAYVRLRLKKSDDVTVAMTEALANTKNLDETKVISLFDAYESFNAILPGVRLPMANLAIAAWKKDNAVVTQDIFPLLKYLTHSESGSSDKLEIMLAIVKKNVRGNDDVTVVISKALAEAKVLTSARVAALFSLYHSLCQKFAAKRVLIANLAVTVWKKDQSLQETLRIAANVTYLDGGVDSNDRATITNQFIKNNLKMADIARLKEAYRIYYQHTGYAKAANKLILQHLASNLATSDAESIAKFFRHCLTVADSKAAASLTTAWMKSTRSRADGDRIVGIFKVLRGYIFGQDAALLTKAAFLAGHDATDALRIHQIFRFLSQNIGNYMPHKDLISLTAIVISKGLSDSVVQDAIAVYKQSHQTFASLDSSGRIKAALAAVGKMRVADESVDSEED